MNDEIYTRKIELKVHVPEFLENSDDQKNYKNEVLKSQFHYNKD